MSAYLKLFLIVILSLFLYIEMAHIDKRPNLNDRESEMSERIIFPDDKILRQPFIEPDIQNFDELSIRTESNEINSRSFVENIDDYPETNILQLLESKKKNFELILDNSDLLADSVENRMGDLWENLCQSVTKIIFPKMANTISGDWKYVINIPNATQGVKIEMCSDEDGKCEMSESFPNGYTSKCKTLYGLRVMAGYDQVTKKLGYFNFKLPTCCQCSLI